MDKVLSCLIVAAFLAIGLTASFWVYCVADVSSLGDMSKQDWLEMADFMTNMLTPILAFLSLCILAWTLKTQTQQIHEAKHANTVVWLIAHIERMEVEIFQALKETELEGYEAGSNLPKMGNAYDAYISKSMKTIGFVSKGKTFAVGKDQLQRDKIKEVSNKIMILKDLLEDYEVLTKDDKRRRGIHSTLGELQKELLKQGYLSEGIDGKRRGMVAKT